MKAKMSGAFPMAKPVDTEFNMMKPPKKMANPMKKAAKPAKKMAKKAGRGR